MTTKYNTSLMMKFSIILFFISISCTLYSQIQVQSGMIDADNINAENPFLDASTAYDKILDNSSSGKGLVFPRTDLTNWEFYTGLVYSGSPFFPSFFDGMIVYNSGFGYTPTTGNNPSVSTRVRPGFYVFSNPTGVDDGAIVNGRWVRLNDSQLLTLPSGVSLPDIVSSSTGDIYYHENLGLMIFNGTTWIPVSPGIPDASATERGVVSTGAQTFAGEKTFTGNISQIGATTFSTGTGNVTLNGNTGLAAGRTLTLNGATSGALILAPAATTTTYSLTLPATQGGNGQVLTNNGSGVLSWNTPAITGVTNLATPAGSNANGAIISGNTLALSLANATNPGLLSAANWTTFNNKVGSVTAASTKVSIGGTVTAPTVDVNTANLGAVGLAVGTTGADVNVSGSPANLGGSITLNIPDASATARGVVNTGAQTFAGAKTFTGNLSQSGSTTFSTGAGNVTLNGNTGLAAGRTLTLNGATSGALTLAPAATTTTYSLTLPAAQGTNGQVLTNNGSGVLSWSTPAIAGVTTLAAPVGSNANGGSISGNTLTLSLVNATNPGLLSAANWTTFNNKVGSVTAASTKVSIGGTATAPTVDVNTANLGTIGLAVGTAGTNVAVTGSPANLGGSITLNIPDASATARGVVNTGAQTFLGAKTFSNNVTAAQFNGSGAGLSGTAASLTAGNAIKLNNMSVSSPANVWGIIPFVGADGVMEIGKYIDFHNGGATDATDYTYRLTQTGSDLNFSGTLSVNSTLTAPTGVFTNVTVNGVLTAPSDIRLKTKIETLTNVLAKLEQLRGVTYEYTDQQRYAKGLQVGVIAQELQKVFPELVKTDDKGYLSVNYTQLTGVLIQAIKEQQSEIDLLKIQMERVLNKLEIK